MNDDRLSRYRASIDNIDAALVCMLAERFKITQAVGEYKAEVGLPPADETRENEQIERLRPSPPKLASTLHLLKSSSGLSLRRSSDIIT